MAFHIDIIDISRISEHERTIIRASRCLPGTKLSVVFFSFFFLFMDLRDRKMKITAESYYGITSLPDHISQLERD